MKKTIIFLIGFVFLSVIVYKVYEDNKNIDNEISTPVINDDVEDKAVFVSYIDYSSLLKNKKEEEQKENIDNIVNNMKNNGFNIIILQVSAFNDAIYESKMYLSSKTIVEKEGDKLNFDILDYFLTKAHDSNLKLYAWVNPFRIRSIPSMEDINKDSYYYEYFNTNKIEINDNGIYLNPASKEVTDKLLEGIKELASNYDIDGILYDDYFYPSNTIDIENYKEYQKEGGTLAIEDYRRSNISNFIKDTYNTIKDVNKNILFGISPAGNIDNNYNEEYLDVSYIINNKYIDFIMPQIYYGFSNQTMPFIETLDKWDNLIKDNDISLYVALALYKAGEEDKFAGTGINEWKENSDIIKKQIVISRLAINYKGFAIFRYNHLFNPEKDNKILKEEINNLLSVI